MEIKEIIELISQLDASNLMHLSYKSETEELVLSKREEAEKFVSLSEPVSAPAAPTNTPAPVVAEPTDEPVAVAPVGQTVDSPIVGVVYMAPNPDAPAFKQVGDTVAVGDVLCIVEAMKVMNEIKSTVSGVVSEILVSNQQVVEFGQPLFRIK